MSACHNCGAPHDPQRVACRYCGVSFAMIYRDSEADPHRAIEAARKKIAIVRGKGHVGFG